MSAPSTILHGVLPAPPWWISVVVIVLILVLGYLMLSVAPTRFN